jgi:ABC-type lipoprotein export system ATPase subunit
MSMIESIPPLIMMKAVTRVYSGPAGDFVALKPTTLTLHAGELIAVTGRSGSGKTTLLNMISGIDRPTAGTIAIGGSQIHAMDEEALAAWRGVNVGLVFQAFQLLPTMTVRENVMLPMEFGARLNRARRIERAMHLLSEVGLADQAHKFPGALSAGQQQRVAIARALSNDPRLILADEPTGNLDNATAEGVFNLFQMLARDGKTILVATHDEQMAGRMPRRLRVSDGHVKLEVVHHPAPFVRAGGQPVLEVAGHGI